MPFEHAPRLCLGTGGFGTSIRRDDAFALMDAHREAGGTALDTAHVYGAWEPGCDGASERIVGQWLRDRGCRRDFLLSTKGAHPPLDRLDAHRVRPECIDQDLAESLERLQVDHVDVYWLHRDDPAVPVGELVDCLEAHAAAGTIKRHGISNWTAPRLWAFHEEVQRRGALARFAGNQVGFSLAHGPDGPTPLGTRWVDQATHDFHARSQAPCWAYSPQAGGFFMNDSREAPPGKEAFAWAWERAENFRRRDAARRIARANGTDANAVALAWLLGRPFPVTAVVGCRTPEQARASLAAASLRLSAAELQELAPTTGP